MARRQREGVKNATINREVTTLKHMLKRASPDYA